MTDKQQPEAQLAERASHGQAPAQAVPAAVAGPSGYGPNVTVRRSCSDCKACNSESYAVQGDSGHYVYCEHPSLPESKYIGDTNWNTPHWCPVSAPTTQPAPQQEAQERVYLVATGETLNGRELYERHEKYVPLADCETLYTAPQQAAGKAVHQFRKQYCADWYDGRADHGDSGGPYEERTLYTVPQPTARGDALDAARYRWLREGNDAKHSAAWHVAVNLYGCEWDAAIDAARAAQEGNKP